jgi:hypothetical protein
MLKPLRLCSLCDGLGKHFYFLFNVRAAQIFAKNPGGNAFRTKFQGGTLFLGFNVFLSTSFLNIFLGGPMSYPLFLNIGPFLGRGSKNRNVKA